MRILDHLTGPEGQAAIKSLSKTLSIPEASVTDALSAIVPEFSRAIERNTLNRGGLADIVASLGRVEASQPLAQTADLASPQAVGFGTGILEQFFGTKDQSRKVAARVADETGLPAELIKKMLPAAAGMTMAALARGSRAPLQQIIGKIPGLAATGPLGMPGASGGDSLPPQTPLPIPGNNLPDLQSPYDDLPDVVRRGGTRVPQGGPSGGGRPCVGARAVGDAHLCRRQRHCGTRQRRS